MSVTINPDEEIPLDELLAAIPVRNESIRSERKEDDQVVVYVPLRQRWYMRPPLSWFLRFSKERGVALDRLGQEVWEQCDGRTSIETIIETFSKQHTLTFHEARLSVMEFLRQLTRRGLIVLVGRPHEEATT